MRLAVASRRRASTTLASLLLVISAATVSGQAPGPATTPIPRVGQGGKDVVWVPTSEALVERMLDLARVTADDVVMDLGSGDGRTVIAAAKRGARAVGVEFSPDLVALSRRLAAEAGVEARATFVEADMYTADISKATVLALFLLPANLERLRDAFLALRPGTRVVINTYAIPEWEPDEQQTLPNCSVYCTAVLYLVPARVQGRWQTTQGDLALEQRFQMVSGTLTAAGKGTPITGRMRGAELELRVGGEVRRAVVKGDRLEGELTGTRLAVR